MNVGLAYVCVYQLLYTVLLQFPCMKQEPVPCSVVLVAIEGRFASRRRGTTVLLNIVALTYIRFRNGIAPDANIQV